MRILLFVLFEFVWIFVCLLLIEGVWIVIFICLFLFWEILLKWFVFWFFWFGKVVFCIIVLYVGGGDIGVVCLVGIDFGGLVLYVGGVIGLFLGRGFIIYKRMMNRDWKNC